MFHRNQILLASACALFVIAAPALAVEPTDVVLHQIVVSATRSKPVKARDIYRHPEQSLAFWGLKRGDTVIDVEPGTGWWTDILAPYLAWTGGHYIAAGADLNDLSPSAAGHQDPAVFEAKYEGQPALHDAVSVVGFGPASGPLARAGSVDLVLASRQTHNWVHNGFIHKAFADFYSALKPGGILAIEDNRAPAGADPDKGNGYLSEIYVIQQARRAGFVLVGRSEINANPRDTRDHPFGVWTLPPTRQSSAFGQPENYGFNHARYDAIGESDRMTLKFVKPTIRLLDYAAPVNGVPVNGVPEPGTWTMMMVGLGLVGHAMRKQSVTNIETMKPAAV